MNREPTPCPCGATHEEYGSTVALSVYKALSPNPRYLISCRKEWGGCGRMTPWCYTETEAFVAWELIVKGKH